MPELAETENAVIIRALCGSLRGLWRAREPGVFTILLRGSLASVPYDIVWLRLLSHHGFKRVSYSLSKM